MDYEDFLNTLQQVAGISGEQAEHVACFTLQLLARRISKGEAEDLAPRLPEELRSCIEYPGPREKYHLDDFLQRMQQYLAADRPTAEKAAKGIFAALWRAVGTREFADMRAQLPGDFQPLLDDAITSASAPPLEDEQPPARFSLRDFLDRITQRGVERDRALQAAEAVLEVLAMRITGGEVEDLIPLVPRELRPALRRGVARTEGRGSRMSLPEFLDEIAEREGVSRDVALQHARAVLAVLHESIGDEEFSDTVAQLPREYRSMLLLEYA
ncbi:DUF2267 domain-containing protein [Pseudonocardia acidicola]|uniref:DUF2267 domain-containing protein n=1 Tax=Pseudonocardia acidicola TaxID=2724939 RepID=A0ABX1SLR3_9PSEU|nr:DUF2267 domain-containing protein [Pseudonocardia acidicola]NMI01723.1 DUF2267 domain-containing protein [Pseudonocardia acidicola]